MGRRLVGLPETPAVNHLLLHFGLSVFWRGSMELQAVVHETWLPLHCSSYGEGTGSTSV